MAAKPRQPSQHPRAVALRYAKAVAMAGVIDANFVRQNPRLDPYDQAGRIRLASLTWSDAIWEQIGVDAGYERKAISEDTRAAVRSIYDGRAKAKLEPAGRRAS